MRFARISFAALLTVLAAASAGMRVRTAPFST